MATRIRLKRGGRKGKPYYRIVVQDSRTRSRGTELENLGVYHPAARPEPVSEVNVFRALHWLRNGAEMSDTARSVMSKLGVLKHLHDGTTPEQTNAAVKGVVAEDAGCIAPPGTPEAPAAPAMAAAPEAATDAQTETAGDE